MTFRRKYEPLCKSWVTEECADAGNDASKVEVVRLPANMNFLAFKLWAPRHLFIDEVVELPGIVIQ